MDLRDKGYNLDDNLEDRRKRIKSLISTLDFREVFRRLEGTKNAVRAEDKERARSDLNWLYRRYRKGYYQIYKKPEFEEELDQFDIELLKEYDRGSDL
jgi:hypothetical protein